MKPGQSSQRSPEEREKLIARNREVAMRFWLEFWDKKRVELANELLDPGIVRHGGGGNREMGNEDVRGIDGYVGFIEMTYEIIPDFHHVVEDVIIDEDTAVGRVTCYGTFTGVYNGVKGKGQKLKFPALDVLKIRDGKVCETWGWFDTYTLFKELEVI
jgi:predicted ester cyclase